jgi:Protein of unknown function (DUF2630)
MDDREALAHISELISEEKELRNHAEGVGLDEAGRARMRELEVQLDQCWDLLSRRRAREEFGQDPDAEHTRPKSVVENYKQ